MNTGHISSLAAFGIANSVASASNVVSRGKVTNINREAHGLWSTSTGSTTNVFVASGVCGDGSDSECAGNGTVVAWNEERQAFVDAAASGTALKTVDEMLNEVVAAQNLQREWTSRLELVLWRVWVSLGAPSSTSSVRAPSHRSYARATAAATRSEPCTTSISNES